MCIFCSQQTNSDSWCNSIYKSAYCVSHRQIVIKSLFTPVAPHFSGTFYVRSFSMISGTLSFYKVCFCNILILKRAFSWYKSRIMLLNNFGEHELLLV